MRRTLTVLFENRQGDLERILGLFATRGLTIEGLSLSETGEPRVMRTTLAVTAEDREVEQVVRQVGRQVRVIRATDMTERPHLERELVLVTVSAEAGHKRQEVLGVVDVFRARVVDMSEDKLVVEATGTPSKVRALLDVLAPLGILDVARTGPVALTKVSGGYGASRAALADELNDYQEAK